FGTSFDMTLTTGQSYHMKLVVTETSVKGYLDGTLILTAPGIPMTGNGYVGFWMLNHSGNATKMTNFAATFGCGESVPGFALKEQLWILTNNLFIGRLQPFCTLDNQIDQGAGTVPPAWVYSTGFSRTAKPGFINEISVLASGVVTVKVS